MIRTNGPELALIVARLIATGGPWVAPVLMLFRTKNPTPYPAPGDFQPPTFSGYADLDPTWDGPISYPNGAVGNSITSVFQGTQPESGPFVPDTAVGWALLNTAQDEVIGWDMLPNPKAFMSATDRLTIHVQIKLPQNLTLGVTQAV